MHPCPVNRAEIYSFFAVRCLVLFLCHILMFAFTNVVCIPFVLGRTVNKDTIQYNKACGRVFSADLDVCTVGFYDRLEEFGI